LAEQKQEQQQEPQQTSDFKSHVKIGPQFALADEDDDPLLKLMPTVVEPVTKLKVETQTRRIYQSGNAHKPVISFPEHWMYRLGLEFRGGRYNNKNVKNSTVLIELDEKQQEIRIRKLPIPQRPPL
jgi:hypothetical protein